jgi:WD40 repeat protein
MLHAPTLRLSPRFTAYLTFMQNLLVSRPGPWWHIKIADFGLSKSQSAYAGLPTTFAGTEGYLAPETLGLDDSGDDQYDRRNPNAVDIWAVGIIAFELLAGEIPFPRHEYRAFGLYARGRGQLPLQKLDANGVSVDGQAAIRQFLSARPSDRPAALAAREDIWFARLAGSIPTADTHSSSRQHGDSQGSARWTAETSHYQFSAPADAFLSQQGSLMPLERQRRPYSSTKDSGYQGSAMQSSTHPESVREYQERPLPQIQTESSTSSTDIPYRSPHDSQETTSEPRHRDHLIARKPTAQLGNREAVQVTEARYQLVQSRTVTNRTPDYWCAVSPEGSVAFVKAFGPRKDPIYWVFDTMTGSVISDLIGLLSPFDVSFSKDNRLLLAASKFQRERRRDDALGARWRGDSLSVWELTSGQMIWQHEGDYAAVALSPDGKLIAAASRYEGVQLWERPTSTELSSLAKGLRCTLILFSPDSRLLASASTSSDSMVIVWDTKGAAEPVHLKTPATEMAFSPNGKLIATAAANTVRLWEVATGTEVGHFSSNRNLSSFSSGPGLNRLSFVSNTELLALSLDKHRYRFLRIFDVSTGISRDLSLHLDGGPNLSRDGLALATDGSLIGYWCKADRDKLRKLMARLSPDKFTEHTSLVVSMWKEKVEY